MTLKSMSSQSLNNIFSKQLHEALNEITNLRCKLESKAKSLIILSQDLLECKREKNEYKLMSEQLKERYSSLKRRLDGPEPNQCLYNIDLNPMIKNSVAFAQLLKDLKDQNKQLMLELEEVKTKLIDSEGDVRLLRNQINILRKQNYFCKSDSFDDEFNLSCNCEKERIKPLIEELEVFKNKNHLLEKDMESLLDEKEDLITTREAYKAKIERINEKLNFVLKKDCLVQETELKIIDIDSLVNENNYLNEKNLQLEEEKQAINLRLTKYKKLLDRYNSNSIFSFGKFNRTSSDLSFNSANLLSSKQLKQFIESNNLEKLEISQTTLNNLKDLVISLFETLTDKSAAYSLQKKNNKLLGLRIKQLEEQIKELKEREKFILKSKSSFDENYLELPKPEENVQSSDSMFEENEAKHELQMFQNSDSSEILLPPKLEKIVENELEKLRKNKYSI